MEEIKKLDFALAYELDEAAKMADHDSVAAEMEVVRLIEQVLIQTGRPQAARAYKRFMIK